MKLIIGLGNVGDKYLFTRHNIGFMVLDRLSVNEGFSFREEKRLKGLITKVRLWGEEFILLKPTTFMNLSGEALRAVIDYYKISIDDILVVYDDLSLDLGKIRFRANGSDGGHNGIKSIIQHLGSKNFARLKVGIGPQPPIPAENFVLQNFPKEQLDTLKGVLDYSLKAIECYFAEGIEKAQNKFN